MEPLRVTKEVEVNISASQESKHGRYTEILFNCRNPLFLALFPFT